MKKICFRINIANGTQDDYQNKHPHTEPGRYFYYFVLHLGAVRYIYACEWRHIIYYFGVVIYLNAYILYVYIYKMVDILFKEKDTSMSKT